MPHRLLLVPFLMLSSLLPLSGQAKQPQRAPDLTAGGRVPEGWTHDWTLGPTGARGWIYSDKLTTKAARQILITEVEKGSPADGVLRPGDVVLGVFGQDFAGDARELFGRAITRAEGKQQRGRLPLKVWRRGKVAELTLKLRPMGDYSGTAPFDCEKSERILKRGLEDLATRMRAKPRQGHVITRALNALALLASGERKHMPVVKQQAEILAEFEIANGIKSWQYAYVNTFLAEYVLATKDRGAVRRGLRRITQRIVDGQSQVGSWGHDFIQPDTGRLKGYGMMNAPGIPLTYSLALARRAKLRVRGLDEAVEKSKTFLRFYVQKGSIPYGDHRAWIQAHCDNGKNEMAAALFDLEQDGEATAYFSRMAVASHGSERDTGHTGNFFNLTWALLGVARSGPEATGAWLKEYGWYFDLARRWDGGFTHQGPPEPKPDKYRRWDATGAYLLAYALPVARTYVTGRQPSCAPAVSGEEAASLIEDGRGWDNADRTSYYAALKTEELMKRLRSWSPVVRERAATELGRRKENLTRPLMAMLRSKSLHARYGACRALAMQKRRAAGAVDTLMGLVAKGDDLWLRVLAAEALAGIGAPAKKAVPLLLRKLAKPAAGDDPRNMERRYLTFSLFSRREGLIGRSLEGVDPALLVPAVRASLTNEDGRARGAVTSVYRNLAFDQLKPLLPAIRQAIAEPAPSGIMFSAEVRMGGLQLLADHHVEDGIEMLVDYARNQRKHSSQKRIIEIMKLLERYGAHARRVIPQMEAVANYFEKEEKDFPKRMSLDKARIVRETIRKISASKKRPKLRKLPRARR